MWARFIAVGLCVIALLGSPVWVATAAVQPFADVLPESTLVYTGWSPSAAGADLAQTRAARMLADDRFAQPWRLLLQRLVLDLRDDLGGGGGVAAGDRISSHFPLLLREAAACDGCFALLEVRTRNRDLAPQAVLLIDLGDHRKAFEEHFQPIHRRLKERLGDRLHMAKLQDAWLWVKTTHDHPDYTWGFVGNRFVFYFGDAADAFLPTLAKPPAHSLKDSAALHDCLAKITIGDAAPVWTTFADVRSGLNLLRTIAKDANDDNVRLLVDRWPKVLAELGLDNVETLGERTTVEGGQFVTRSLLRTKGEPHGLLASLAGASVDDAMLKAVPRDAMFAVTGRTDFLKAYTQLKAAAVEVAGEDGRRAFGDLEDLAAGFGLPVNNLLGPLGGQWVAYEAASTGGFFLTGLTVVVEAKDPKALSKSLDLVAGLLAGPAVGEGRGRAGAYETDGATVHYVEPRGFTLFTPSWALVDGKLIVGLYPQVVEDAVRQLKIANDSLLDNPQFVAVRKQVGSDGPLLYLSESEFARSLYPLVLPLVAAAREIDPELAEGEVPTAQLLPSLQRLLQYVGADAASLKLTPDGVLRTTTVANPLLSPLTVTDSLPLWVALSLPTLGSARENADRVTSAANLHQIGQGIAMYAGSHNGRLPPDLAAALRGPDLSKDALHSPFAQPGAVGGDYKYFFVDGPNLTVPPDVVIAYDAAELDKGDGANVLYGDGHVEWLERDAVQNALEKSAKWREEQRPSAKP